MAAYHTSLFRNPLPIHSFHSVGEKVFVELRAQTRGLLVCLFVYVCIEMAFSEDPDHHISKAPSHLYTHLSFPFLFFSLPPPPPPPKSTRLLCLLSLSLSLIPSFFFLTGLSTDPVLPRSRLFKLSNFIIFFFFFLSQMSTKECWPMPSNAFLCTGVQTKVSLLKPSFLTGKSFNFLDTFLAERDTCQAGVDQTRTNACWYFLKWAMLYH